MLQFIVCVYSVPSIFSLLDVIALSYHPQHRWQMCWTELKEEHLDVPRAAHKAHFRRGIRRSKGD